MSSAVEEGDSEEECGAVVVDYEEALNRCAFGKYQIGLLFACGLVVRVVLTPSAALSLFLDPPPSLA